MEVLLKAWRSESAFRPVYRHLTFTQSGLELGAGTVIVPAANDNGDSLLKIDHDPSRILALLSVPITALSRPWDSVHSSWKNLIKNMAKSSKTSQYSAVAF